MSGETKAATLRLHQVRVLADRNVSLLKKAAGILGIPAGDITNVKIVRQSVDARKKPVIYYIYTLDVTVKNPDRVPERFKGKENTEAYANTEEYRFPDGERGTCESPVIIGTGPAGLFCGYFLALKGLKPILLERGKCVEERKLDVERFWRTGLLDPSSNVQFGEGGAGTFSDGKLNTLVKDSGGRNLAVLKTFVRFGAKESICYEAKPHIGTDVLGGVVANMRKEIIRLGGTVCFSSCVTDIHIQDGKVCGVTVNGERHIKCSQVVLACGHSARDTFSMLCEKGVPMEAKAFAVGFRVEHPQAMINLEQYGREDPASLGAASYKVTAGASNGRSVYSFCMCPGGYVVNASSEEGRTAVNGMSYSGRSGKNANSAVIVSVTPDDFGSTHPLAGVSFQRRLEERAYELGKGKIPMQRYGDFRGRILGEKGRGAYVNEPDSLFLPQCKGDYVWTDLSHILPEECNRAFVEGMDAFGRQIKGFDRPDAILSGVESRTSSPVRIKRDKYFQSEVRGLYPCGEGAGYAGGITSAAMDGIRVAEAVFKGE